MAVIDVRPDIQKGGDPFDRIMKAVAGLEPGEPLEIIAPFEPVPLYAVMEDKGFSYQAKATPDGAWRVVFTRRK